MLSEDELALLEAIRDSGSLSRAAARLGKAPSTVSTPPGNWKAALTPCCSTAAATACNSHLQAICWPTRPRG
ncbi:helix-turn-helix domain-containing protein [Cupriavidus sp. D39]|uniref:helix-turn-helix domain-containing protein n=1 Tax=Cupriavidus sp. D39 TaxID=2997877 RepID=UPI00226FFE19|nr:LysR family transcriptional regulator [Cupriavidus sp. D39]MCY0857913.1 LysR family transcriptional regulator [Cupriavidus sp. D39]